MPDEPADRDASPPPARDTQSIVYVNFAEMSDGDRKAVEGLISAEMWATSVTPVYFPVTGQHDPITPAEAAEELDDRESDEGDDGSPRDRTWAEYDAYIEANRRFDLDVVEKASAILATHARPIDSESSGDVAWRLCRAPQGFEDRVGVFLDGVAEMGMDALGRLKDHA